MDKETLSARDFIQDLTIDCWNNVKEFFKISEKDSEQIDQRSLTFIEQSIARETSENYNVEVQSDLDTALSEQDSYETDGDSDYIPQKEEIEAVERTDTEENENNDVTRKQKTRKRVRSEENWRRNRIKRLRNSGQTYRNWRDKVVSARKIKATCSCRMKCPTKFSEENRQAIFDQYWGLGDINRQRDFISKYVRFLPKSRCRQRHNSNGEISVNSRRSYTYTYTLPSPNSTEMQVCKTFFLNTLDISSQTVKTVAKKCTDNIIVPADNRGRVKKNCQLPEEIKESVRQHIKCFVPVESHYCRKDSNRLLLSPDLNVARMYSLYREYCESTNISQIASSAIYRQIFSCEFNISFLVPKKDQCDLCNRFNNSTLEQKSELEKEYSFHVKSKDLARESKNKDKEQAKDDITLCTCVFDLEQILPVPKTEISLAYYKLKLSTYNFTIFNLASKEASCYMWHEGIARRGSSEIGSCLLLFIQEQVGKGIKEFSFYSDNCSGQNRNKYLYSLYNYLAKEHKIKIRHNYLEKGHTQNEGDSVHSVIERASKNIPIYCPDQWYTMVRTSKRSNPQYQVTEMSKETIFDLKDLQLKTSINWEKDINNDKVKWQKIKIVEVNIDYPDTLLFKYDYEEKEYNKINLVRKGRKSLSQYDYTMKPLYQYTIPITRKKYDHLLFLCNKLVIPTPYHNFFKELAYGENIREDEDSDN